MESPADGLRAARPEPTAVLSGEEIIAMRRRRQGGFTLVELAGATVVASVALVATAAAVTSGAAITRACGKTRAAVRLSEALLEKIRATPFTDLQTTWDGTTHPIAEFGGGDSQGSASVSVTPVDTGSTRWLCYQVRVVTKFNGGGGPDPATFVTYVSDRSAGSSLVSHATIPADTIQ